MEETTKEEYEKCGICLDVLTNPVTLPCSHKFCPGCLNSWRSKYGILMTKSGDEGMGRKCPLCREKIPPTKEMVAELKFYRNRKSEMEAKGDVFSERYRWTVADIEKLEREVGDGMETIEYSEEEKRLELPKHLLGVAENGNIQKLLDWLGPHPVDKQRLNAKYSGYLDYTLMHSAALNRNSDVNVLSILLQFGAEVDVMDTVGMTPLGLIMTGPEYDAQARLLLEWGAEITKNAKISADITIDTALHYGNKKLAKLLKTEFGGRRCEVINLQKRPDLIGKTCVVEKYLPDKGRYKVVFEVSKEAALVGPQKLKRRDRTPEDCGYYISYKNGRITRHEFASKEECQAFVASLTDENKSGDGDAEAEAPTEEAAAGLLTELSIDSSKSGGK